MADRPPDDMPGSDDPRAERFEHYLDALLAGGRPSPDHVSDRDEAEMARLAAELSAAADPESGSPDPAFVEQLRLRMRQADQGIASVRTPLPLRPAVGGGPGRVRVTRRQLLLAGLSGAAGLAAGAAGLQILRPATEDRDWIWDDGTELVTGEYEWVNVASAGDIPEGGAVRFSTASFDGYVVNDGGQIRALSAVCTHMGCTLQFRPEWHDLRCPCHAASFDLTGALANGRERWRSNGAYPGDDRAYPIDLPDLVRPEIRVQDGVVWVKAARI